MARKRQRQGNRPPRTPRSVRRRDQRPDSAEASVVATATPAGAPKGVTPPRATPINEDYSHIRKDLVRIAVFGTAVFAAMFALRLFGI